MKIRFLTVGIAALMPLTALAADANSAIDIGILEDAKDFILDAGNVILAIIIAGGLIGLLVHFGQSIWDGAHNIFRGGVMTLLGAIVFLSIIGLVIALFTTYVATFEIAF